MVTFKFDVDGDAPEDIADYMVSTINLNHLPFSVCSFFFLILPPFIQSHLLFSVFFKKIGEN